MCSGWMPPPGEMKRRVASASASLVAVAIMAPFFGRLVCTSSRVKFCIESRGLIKFFFMNDL